MSENYICRGFVQLLQSCGFVVAAALAPAIAPSPHESAYLPLIGPPSLRFERVKSAKETSLTPMILPMPAVASNSTVAISPVSTNQPTVAPPVATQIIAPFAAPPENLSTNSAPPAASANNLLIVTPEMLVDYFKPNGNPTNQANVRVTAPVNFTPPASALTPSSQAIYQSP